MPAQGKMQRTGRNVGLFFDVNFNLKDNAKVNLSDNFNYSLNFCANFRDVLGK